MFIRGLRTQGAFNSAHGSVGGAGMPMMSLTISWLIALLVNDAYTFLGGNVMRQPKSTNASRSFNTK